MTQRTPQQIARDIRANWKNPYFGAVPYLDALSSMSSWENGFHADSSKTIIVYFLANASTWRGEVARAVKKELKSISESLTY